MEFLLALVGIVFVNVMNDVMVCLSATHINVAHVGIYSNVGM
ncbi:hypothetical protein DB29_01306 [Shouchella clausii]|nr:hypothetical protein DB29_01306 [Shouchella clausii]